ncbi:MAG: histidine phosphatase family protein [Clostridia bacterium]|nr:histidine phosphatase family protein [Clostridia bacterium]
MTKIYLIRHCEAMGNLHRVFQGSTDADISENGKIQLSYLRRRFADIPIDKVYASPLIRAQKTAHAIADEKGLPVELVPDLREFDGGIVENKPFVSGLGGIPALVDAWNNHPQDFHPEGGEAMRDVYERIWHAVADIVQKNPGKTVAAASHGVALRCLICRLLKNTIEELKNIPWTENTAVTLVEFDEQLHPTVCFFNDHSHVPPEYLPKRSRILTLSSELVKEGKA